MPMYNSIEYTIYAKTGILWQYCRDEPGDDVTNLESYKFKSRFTNNTSNVGTVSVKEVAVPLIYLSNFWRSTEMTLINCETSLMQTWAANCVICEEDRVIVFSIN